MQALRKENRFVPYIVFVDGIHAYVIDYNQ